MFPALITGYAAHSFVYESPKCFHLSFEQKWDEQYLLKNQCMEGGGLSVIITESTFKLLS